MIMVSWLGHIHAQPVLEVNLTITFAFICFFVCETYAGASGILALVTMGLFMNYKGQTRISVESHHMLHSVWMFIQFIAETGVFVLAGVIMAARMGEYITAKDFMKNMALYVILHIIRFCGLVILTPFMNRMDYKLDFPSIVFASYAGMRGAVALCLALLLTENTKVPKSVSMLVLFHVCGTVVWTLAINGMTAGWLLNALGLQKEKKIAQKLMGDFLKKLDTKRDLFCEEAKAHDHYCTGVNWDNV